MRLLTLLPLALLAAGGLLSTAAHAQDAESAGVDVELFRPASDGMGYLSVPSADTLGNLQAEAAFWLNYANDPVILTDANGNRVPATSDADGEAGNGLIDDRLTGHLLLGMGISRWSSVTVDLPVTLFQDGVVPDTLSSAGGATAITGGGLGDIRVIPKLTALHSEDGPVGLAIVLPVGLPTGDTATLTGEQGVSVAPAVVFEVSDGEVRRQEYRWRFAATAGYRVRQAGRVRDVRMGSAATWGIAAGVAPGEIVELMAELHGEVGGSRSSQLPAEGLLGIKLLPTDWTALHIGGGSALLPGVGAPDYRVVAGLSVLPGFDPDDRDSDRDGIPDGTDRCVNDPEDIDDFQDDDGCPENDNDVDGIPDANDDCPDDPEDDDGWLDNDGCPDKDNDKDEIPDIEDRCPNDAETWNDIQDEDGCPDEELGDKDGDGFTDNVDRCPYDAEDFDGDRDGDGCPDEGRVVVEKSNIKITEAIFFDTGKATIQERSFDLLNEIATVITANPQLKSIRVEGHTDNVGGDANNLRLSNERAKSVRQYLIDQGVEAGRLEARGFGEMYPIQSNDTDEGRAANRRVEFIIVDQD